MGPCFRPFFIYIICLNFFKKVIDIDLFHSFGNHLPAHSDAPRSFTVHDFRALDRPERDRGRGRSRLERNIDRARGIICLTEHGRGRLLRYGSNLADCRIAVIPHGVDHERFRPQGEEQSRAAARRFGLDAPYVLQLGSWFPHKNLELSMRAFALSDCRAEGQHLAFVGGGADGARLREWRDLARREGIGDVVHWIEHVGGDEVPLVVAGSRCLLQPSRYEGFALPLLEAMACGVPGVVAESSCLPEVSGGAWPVIDQDDVAGFAAAMDRMALDEDERDLAIAAGLAWSGRFTWERTGRATARFLLDCADA